MLPKCERLQNVHHFLPHRQRVGVGKAVDSFQVGDVDVVLAGDAVKGVAAGNDVIGACRQPQNLSDLKRVRRLETVGVDQVAQRHVIAFGNAVKGVAFLDGDRLRRAEQRGASGQPEQQYSYQSRPQFRFTSLVCFKTVFIVAARCLIFPLLSNKNLQFEAKKSTLAAD